MGAAPEQRLPFYFVALGLLGAALYCFYKGYRGFSGDLPWVKSKNRDAEETPKKRTLSRFADPEPDPKSGFDVEAAFSRYMNGREPDNEQTQEPAAPRPPRGGFGRKGL